MIKDASYKNALFIAIFLHFSLGLALFIDTHSNQPPVMTLDAKNEPSKMLPLAEASPKEEIVKAVSVDSKDVLETVTRLKEARNEQLRAEKARQDALANEAAMAKRQRLEEQQRLTKLKEEAEKLAIARKKQIEDEKKHLQELALEKAKETKRLQELKAEQEQLKKAEAEAKKLAEIKKKEALEQDKLKKIQEAKAKEEAAKAERLKAELAEKERQKAANAAAARQAALDAAKSAHIAGEVDKYKALIVNAIGRQWILPENVDNHLSSQFRIRLAPDGAVLEVSLLRSSGDSILDRSAQSAIYKASPLPVPTDAETFNLFRDISLTVRPENVRG